MIQVGYNLQQFKRYLSCRL